VQIFLEEEAVRAEEEEEWKTKRKKASHTKQKKITHGLKMMRTTTAHSSSKETCM
jgi:hypothetical protein